MVPVLCAAFCDLCFRSIEAFGFEQHVVVEIVGDRSKVVI